MAPNVEMGRLNCSRLFAYSTDCLMAILEPPNTPAANLILPMFKMFKAILKPSPRSPNKFSTGTFTLLKNTWRVDEPLIPIFFSSGFREIPSYDFSTKNALKFLSSSIFANTVKKSAKPALVIHIFCPLRM